MEMERDGHLPFLDIDIYHKPDGSLGHTVYHKWRMVSVLAGHGNHLPTPLKQ
jgi:hypothetical protein